MGIMICMMNTNLTCAPEDLTTVDISLYLFTLCTDSQESHPQQ